MSLFNIADLNIPALLFVGQEERGRARLTIGPNSRIVMLAVRVTHSPIVNRASKSGARSQDPVPSTRAHSLEGKTPSLDPRATQRARSQEPVPPREKARFRISGRQSHKDNAQHPRVQARRDH